jgi:hypothetical protein
MSDELTEARVREIAREEAEQTLFEHTIPQYPNYFMQNEWLVTYDWLESRAAPLRSEIDYLRGEIAKLQRPWWKRWWSR